MSAARPVEIAINQAAQWIIQNCSGMMLQPHRQMMGTLEAADGMLLFGISTVFIFTVVQFYYQHLVLQRPGGSVKAR